MFFFFFVLSLFFIVLNFLFLISSSSVFIWSLNYLFLILPFFAFLFILFAGQRVVVVGDSVQRFVYYSLIRSLGYETPAAHDTSLEKHSDFSWPGDGAESKTSIDFLWAPLADNLASRVSVFMREGGKWLYSSGICSIDERGMQ